MKQIHFYTDLTNEEQTSEWDLDTMCTDFVTTMREIDNLKQSDEGIVKTTQLELLRSAWDWRDQGIDVFIHVREESLKVEPGMGGTNKEIHPGHDLSRLLCGGTFGKIYTEHEI